MYFDGELAGQGGGPTDNYGDDFVSGGADIYIGLGVFDALDVAWGDTGPLLYIDLVNPSHPLSAGLPAGALLVNEYDQEFAWGVPTAEAVIIATLEADPTRPVLYAYDKGAALIDDSPAAERRVFFMLTDDTFLALNEDGLKLFDAAVAWAALPFFFPPTVQGNDLVLSWIGGGTLQFADTPNGPWTDITGATSAHPVPITGSGRFFRIER